MADGRISVRVPVRAPASAVWDAVTDWEAQGEWMPATRVRVVGGGDGRGVGARIEAFTGFGRVGVLDTMVVTDWRPPTWCAVEHTGRVIRGTGDFSVDEAPDGAVFTWSEDLELPGGRLGALGWKLISPFVRLAVRHALTRLAHSVPGRSG